MAVVHKDRYAYMIITKLLAVCSFLTNEPSECMINHSEMILEEYLAPFNGRQLFRSTNLISKPVIGI